MCRRHTLNRMTVHELDLVKEMVILIERISTIPYARDVRFVYIQSSNFYVSRYKMIALVVCTKKDAHNPENNWLTVAIKSRAQ